MRDESTHRIDARRCPRWQAPAARTPATVAPTSRRPAARPDAHPEPAAQRPGLGRRRLYAALQKAGLSMTANSADAGSGQHGRAAPPDLRRLAPDAHRVLERPDPGLRIGLQPQGPAASWRSAVRRGRPEHPDRVRPEHPERIAVRAGSTVRDGLRAARPGRRSADRTAPPAVGHARQPADADARPRRPSPAASPASSAKPPSQTTSQAEAKPKPKPSAQALPAVQSGARSSSRFAMVWPRCAACSRSDHGERGPMTEAAPDARGPPDARASAAARVDAGPGVLEAVDPGSIPRPRRAPARSAARPRARWEALLDEGAPILADGAMGTMLFLTGLQFGDPPEVWNLTQPEVIRRIHRGYLEAGSRILLTNTFGGNRLRLGPASPRGTGRRAEPDGGDPAPLRGRGGRRARRAGRRRHRTERRDHGARSAPSTTTRRSTSSPSRPPRWWPAGVDLIWIETMSDLTEIKAAIEGVRRVAPGIPLITTMTFDTRGRTMMGVTPEQAVEALAAWGADAIGGNCGNGPDEILPVITKMRAVAPDVDPRREVERGHARADRHAGRLPRLARDAGRGRGRDADGRGPDRRRLLRQHARSPAGDERRRSAKRPRGRRR